MFALAYEIFVFCPFDIDKANALSTLSIAGALGGVLALIIAAVIIVIVIVLALKRQV